MFEAFGGKLEAEVLDLYKIEDIDRDSFKGRGAPLEWRRVRRSRNTEQESGREDCWVRIFALFRGCNLQWL